MMNREIVKVVEKGVELDIPFHACVLYHGKDSIGGLSLGYRLMYWALNYLSEDGEIPRREDISFKTAFPGPGLRDAVEMISRAVTAGRYEVLKEAPLCAPEGVYGHMYFEISLRDKTVKVALKPGVIDDDFIQTGRSFKKENLTPEGLRHWEDLKKNLAEKVWSVENLSDVLPVIN